MILDDIIAARRDDLAAAQRAHPLEALRERPGWALPRHGFAAALPGRGPEGSMVVCASENISRIDCTEVDFRRLRGVFA